MSKTLVLIPSRMSATRLPGKPLLKINNLSIISHVYKKAKKADIGQVVVATEDQEIFSDVIQNGGKAILTNKNHKTGTDRIFEAFEKLDMQNVETILNLQGDEPNIDESDIKKLNKMMINNNFEMGTLAAEIKDQSILDDENIVKVIIKNKLNKENFPLAINFIRKKKDNINGNLYHHIGIYSYKVKTLKKFVQLKQSNNETLNKLEQLRALDNGIKINVALAKSSPIGVDTMEDFLAIKKIMEYKS